MKLPFRIDRDGAESLVSQFASGISMGIETGFWKAGDILPTLDEFAAASGVSLIVVRHAIKRLVQKGLVCPRPGVGTVVLKSSMRLWRGHVVLVDFETRSNFFFSRINGILRERLIRMNYLPSVVSVAAEEYDIAPLNSILRQPTNLAVVFGEGHGHAPEVVQRISAAGVPILMISDRSRPMKGVVGNLRLDISSSLEKFAQNVRELGVRRIADVRLRPQRELSQQELLKNYGIISDTWRIEPAKGIDPIENVQKGTMDFFEGLIASDKPDLPELIYFDDDYAAAAAMVSLLYHGIRIPQDVRIVSRTHRGCTPPFPVPFARIEDDPFYVGEVLSDMAVSFLDGKSIPGQVNVCTTFIST